LVVEVLSPSTERRDRGTKLDAYREHEGLDDILLVKTNQRLVEHHHRVSESEWLVTLVRKGAVALQGLGVILSIDELYASVDALPADEDVDAEPLATEPGGD
jgi:Uma2 family endonuclease